MQTYAQVEAVRRWCTMVSSSTILLTESLHHACQAWSTTVSDPLVRSSVSRSFKRTWLRSIGHSQACWRRHGFCPWFSSSASRVLVDVSLQGLPWSVLSTQLMQSNELSCGKRVLTTWVVVTKRPTCLLPPTTAEFSCLLARFAADGSTPAPPLV